MKSLSKHNDEAIQNHKAAKTGGTPAAVECPVCKAELWYEDPCVTQMQPLPRKVVVCPKCNFFGYKIV